MSGQGLLPAAIGFTRKDDPQLYSLYQRKLLIPGWAGELTAEEAAYIASELTKSVTLRRQWQTKRFSYYFRKITPAIVLRMAAWWSERPVQEKKRERQIRMKTADA